jgi:hypothetical protein
MGEEDCRTMATMRLREDSRFSSLYQHFDACDACKMKLVTDPDKDITMCFLVSVHGEGLRLKLLCKEAREMLMRVILGQR